MTVQVPSKTFNITLQGNTYGTKITQGKIIDYELNKVTISRGFYNSISDVQTLNLIDSIAALLAFFPEIKKDKKVEDLLDLEPTETKELFIVMEPFFEWYLEWKKFMQAPSERVEEKKDEEGAE